MPRPPRLALLVCALALSLSAAAASSAAPAKNARAAAVATQVGNGTPASCTAVAFRNAVTRGGTITFDCGPRPKTITLDQTAKVRNDKTADVIIDGGGLITLSGADQRRILYQNACDPALGITSSHCQDQATPRLTLRGLTFTRGNSTGQKAEGGGGGAVFVRGGQLRVVDSVFTDNRCDTFGPDLGGAAIRVLDQFNDGPVLVNDSTFTGGRCSNGGALSSIGVSWRIVDSVFRGNQAIGRGANPARSGTPGGGSGGAIYNDGNTFSLKLVRTTIENNLAHEGGGAIFYVSNDRSGTLSIAGSYLSSNPSQGFENYPGIFYLGRGEPTFSNSTIE